MFSGRHPRIIVQPAIPSLFGTYANVSQTFEWLNEAYAQRDGGLVDVIVADVANVETAAFQVGYESASQYSREYSRIACRTVRTATVKFLFPDDSACLADFNLRLTAKGVA